MSHESISGGRRSLLAVTRTSRPALRSCKFKESGLREIKGQADKNSAYSVLEFVVQVIDDQGELSEPSIKHGILPVRSCPTDSTLVDDSGTEYDNRDVVTSKRPVACLSPAPLPKSASLGVPRESGANQCPIGNSPTVGNPITVNTTPWATPRASETVSSSTTQVAA